MAEAAERLGITKEAVRKRISRGTLHSDRDPDGTVHVYVPASSTPSGTAGEARDELVEAMRGEIVHLRRESERKDAIIMSLSQANAEQARTIREIEAPQEPEDAAESIEEEPEKVAPHSAMGEAQEGAEPLEQPSGWLAPVDKLPWWHYALGICSVFLTTFLTAFLGLSEGDPAAGDTGATINLATINLVEFAGLWAIPGVFGYWVGFRQRYSHFWSRVIPLGALLALMVGLGAGIPYEVWLTQSNVAPPENIISDFLLLVLGFGIFFGLPEWLLFVSTYLIGHARQRRRIGRISGTTPASPVSRIGQGAARQPQQDLSPAQQAMLGWGGTIISALISLGGTIITVRSGP